MAISKQRKEELVTQYRLAESQPGSVRDRIYRSLDEGESMICAAKLREAGGEFHIVKNTLGKVAFKSAGLQLPDELLRGSTAVVFAFRDAPALAKVMYGICPHI